MSWSRWAVFAAGVVVGAGVAVTVVERAPRADAQQFPPLVGKPPEAGRYQIAAFGTGTTSNYGAYLTDTMTGEVFMCEQKNAPRSIGMPGGK
jgi:hypothetical protein